MFGALFLGGCLKPMVDLFLVYTFWNNNDSALMVVGCEPRCTRGCSKSLGSRDIPRSSGCKKFTSTQVCRRIIELPWKYRQLVESDEKSIKSRMW